MLANAMRPVPAVTSHQPATAAPQAARDAVRRDKTKDHTDNCVTPHHVCKQTNGKDAMLDKEPDNFDAPDTQANHDTHQTVEPQIGTLVFPEPHKAKLLCPLDQIEDEHRNSQYARHTE